MFLSFDD